MRALFGAHLGVVPDGQALPPAPGDGPGDPLARHARGQWGLHASVQPTPSAGWAGPAGSLVDEPDATTGCTGSFASGRLTHITDASGSTSYCYDRFGRLTQKRQTTLGTLLTVSYSYDASGRIASIVHPNGVEVSYGRDALGRVTSVQFKPNAGAAAQTIVSAGSHCPATPSFAR
jgi:YD repeat-containing protein